jgi:hypothetical protein
MVWGFKLTNTVSSELFVAGCHKHPSISDEDIALSCKMDLISFLELLCKVPVINRRVIQQLLKFRRSILWCQSVFNGIYRSLSNLHLSLKTYLGAEDQRTLYFASRAKDFTVENLLSTILRVIFEDLLRIWLPSASREDTGAKLKIGPGHIRCTGKHCSLGYVAYLSDPRA